MSDTNSASTNPNASQATPAALDTAWTDAQTEGFPQQRANRVARNAVTATNVMAAARDVTHMRSYHDTYGISRAKTGEITNQRQSGRCWMFASLNVARAATMELLDVDSFEFSQAFGMFYDKLEKANSTLERIIETADQPIDSREVAYILNDGVGDGGFVPFAMNLIQKYGLVPKDAMPETACSKNSSEMNQELERLIRKDALALRRQAAAGAPAEELRTTKQGMLADIHRLLCVCLGEPPVSFDLEVKVGSNAKVNKAKLSPIEPANAKDGKGAADEDASAPASEQAGADGAVDAEGARNADDKDDGSESKKPACILRDKGITPREFAERYVPIDPSDWVDLISIPGDAHPFGHVYHVTLTDSVEGGQPLRSLNCPMEVLEDAAIRSLKAGVPVAMACDVMQEFPRHIADFKYVLATDTMDFEGLFGCDLSMSREDLVESGETTLTHEMTFQGVELDAEGRPVAWRVENSWGKDAGKDGYLIMSGDWFRTYGGNVTVRREFVDEATLKAFDELPAEDIEPWRGIGRNLQPRD